MKLATLTAPFAALLLAAGQAQCHDLPLDFGRLGPMKIGMTPKTIEALKGSRKEIYDTSLKKVDVFGCDGVYLSDMYLQFESGKLDEIKTGSKQYRMANGIGVGSTYADIERLYGKGGTEEDGKKRRVVIYTDHYDDNVHYALVEAPPNLRRVFAGKAISIAFEFEPGPITGKSRVTGLSVGHHWVEGCA